jgi:hypothetical protein
LVPAPEFCLTARDRARQFHKIALVVSIAVGISEIAWKLKIGRAWVYRKLDGLIE